MSEHLAQPPLWDEHGHVGFGDLGVDLGPALEEDLTAWQEHFEEHFRCDRPGGWDAAEAGRWYVEEGCRLHLELEWCLEREVVLDLWHPDGDR